MTVLDRPARPPDLVLRYGDEPEHVVDVRLPTRQTKPLLIFVHGGFWRAVWDRTHTGPLAEDLAARGWPVASIEFRRVGQPGGGWPGTLDDVAAAVRATPGLLAAARPELDTTAPILSGHSAGGHLVLWLGAERAPTDGGVVALAPVADLADAYQRGIGNGAVAELMDGGPVDRPERYAQADPMVRPRPQAPTVLVHGSADDVVPVELSQNYAQAKRVPLSELRGEDHFAVIDPQSTAWPTVLAALDTVAAGRSATGR